MDVYLGQWGQQIGFWEGVAQKIDYMYVTQNNLSKLRNMGLQVF